MAHDLERSDGRPVAQLTISGGQYGPTLYAVCKDGTAWVKTTPSCTGSRSAEWEPLAAIPDVATGSPAVPLDELLAWLEEIEEKLVPGPCSDCGLPPEPAWRLMHKDALEKWGGGKTEEEVRG